MRSTVQPRGERLFLNGFTIVLLAIMLAPIAIIIFISFTVGDSLQFPPPEMGLRWYRSVWRLLSEPSDISRLQGALATSLAISAAVMVLSAAVGTPAAYALARYRFPGRGLIEALLALPLIFPLVVLGVALLVIASLLGVEWGFARIIVAHVTLTLPFVIRNVLASMHALPRSQEEAAKVLGAPGWRIAYEIVLPGVRTGIIAGMLFAFIISFNEFTVAYFLYTVDVFPLSVWIFSRSNTVLDPTIFAIASIIIVLDVVLIILLDRWSSAKTVSL